MVTMDRRRFLKTAAATLPLVRAGDSFVLAQPAAVARADSSASHPAAADVPWQKSLRRIGQTNFTEHDPAVLDVEAWADYWAGAHLGGV
jgi:hypothetical protein